MITHSSELAKKFLVEIKKTRSSGGKPGKNRSCVISEDVDGNALVLISKKKPLQAAALAKNAVSPKAVKNLLVGQIFWEENEFKINVTKGNQKKGKVFFKQYFIDKEITLPTKTVRFIEVPDDQIDFEEDPDDDNDDGVAAVSRTPVQMEAGESANRSGETEAHVRAARNFETVQALVGRLPANDDRARRGRGMLAEVADRLKRRDTVAAVALMTRIALLLREPASVPGPSTKETGPRDKKDVFSSGLRFAQADMTAARAVKGNPNESAELGQLVRAMVAASSDQQFAQANILADQAHKLAIKMLAGEKEQQVQSAMFDKMAPVLKSVEASYFTDRMIKGLEDAQKTLGGGTHFKALVNQVKAFQATPSAEMCDAIMQSARDFLAHQDDDLSDRQRGSKNAQRKKGHAESAQVAARHMKMALEMKALGAPPWDEPTAMKATGLYAAFEFETTVNIHGEQAGTKADRLSSGTDNQESGVSASFWVRGRPAGSTPGTPATKEFLFKPAKGEQSVPGFPRGGSAPREVLSKRLADNVLKQTGLDLGVPATSLVGIAPQAFDGESYNADLKKQLDLIRDRADRHRVEEKMLPVDRPTIGSLQQFMESAGPLKGAIKNDPSILNRIPVENTHQVAILDILTLNCDRHAENFMVTKGDTPRLIPIDHGLTFPSGEALDLIFSQKLNNPIENVVLCIPGSLEPFAEDTIRRLEMLDTAALADGTRASIASIDTVHPGFGVTDLVPEHAIRCANRAALVLKRACRRLSPALIQILLGTERARIFKSTDDEFEATLEEIIARYERDSAWITEMIRLEFDNTDNHGALMNKGWHDLRYTPAQQCAYREWAYANPQIVVSALTTGATPPPGYIKPAKPVVKPMH